MFYVHFNKYNELSDHVVYQLKKMQNLFERVVFISNSLLSDEDKEKLDNQQLITDFIQRENKGYDFAAWHDGMIKIGFNVVMNYDSVTLMNDTCFGPLYDMTPFYEDCEKRKVNFWGMTNHRAYQESKGHYFDEHIQSYFKVFDKSVTNSATFKEFWSTIQSFEYVQQVIDNYEIQSTTAFLDAGFRYETILDTRSLDDSHLLHPDFSYYAPDVILQKNVPFIKIKSFQAFENDGIAKYMLDYIKDKTDYPIDLILTHLSNVGYPDYNFLVASKYLAQVDVQPIHQKVAVHLHTFYVDLLEEFLDGFSNFHFDYDLYLTTNTEEKRQKIIGILNRRDIPAQVILTANYGRDVLPFLSLKKKLQHYDIIGHFHTKRSLEAAFFAGESWRTELSEMMIKPADLILQNFSSNKKLGIVIADIPSFFRFNRVVDSDVENKMIAPIMNDVWKRMKMRKKVNFHDFKTFTMSYGTFFWAKKEVLDPLFELEIMKKEIPAEPLPQNTILHAIERMMIYLAWDKGLDFKISPNSVQISPFIDARTFNQRFGISEENAKDISLKFALKLTIKKTRRFIIYRFYKFFHLNTTKLFKKDEI